MVTRAVDGATFDRLDEALNKIAWYRQRQGAVGAACLLWWVDELKTITGNRAVCMVSVGSTDLIVQWRQ